MSREIDCPVCAAPNDPSRDRCASCGARLESLVSVPPEGEEYEAHPAGVQRTFSPLWLFISFALDALFAVFVLVFVPFFIDAIDPQGLPGVFVIGAMWGLFSFAVAFASRGRTVLEPAVGAIFMAGPVIFFIDTISDVRAFDLMEQVFAGLALILLSVAGAILGEKLQGATRGHPDEH